MLVSESPHPRLSYRDEHVPLVEPLNPVAPRRALASRTRNDRTMSRPRQRRPAPVQGMCRRKPSVPVQKRMCCVGAPRMIRRVAHLISQENGASRSGLPKDHESADVESWNDLKSN